jgi:N12 class adenine-specific DNA methylase
MTINNENRIAIETKLGIIYGRDAISVEGEDDYFTLKDVKFTTETLSGKTLVTIKDRDNGQPSGCWTFNNDKTIDAIFKKDGELIEMSSAGANWNIVDDKLTFITDGTDYQLWELIQENSDGTFTFINEWYSDEILDDRDTTRKLKVVSECPVNELVND